MTNSSSTSTSTTTGGSLLLLCEEEESWAGRRIPVSLLYSGLAIGGTLANGMVIYLVSSFRKLQTTQPLVWVSLASGFSLPVPWGVQAASWLLCCALSALNPLLYTWRNEEFRRSVRSVLPGVGDAAAAAAAATAVPAMSQAQLGTRAAGQHW